MAPGNTHNLHLERGYAPPRSIPLFPFTKKYPRYATPKYHLSRELFLSSVAVKIVNDFSILHQAGILGTLQVKG